MSLLTIVHYPDPVLLQVGKPVGEDEFGPELASLVDNMFETMYSAGGVGLAAPQIGVSKRLFVMDCSGGDDPEQKIAFINPEIVNVEGEQYGEEGCLSFPGVFTKVRREMRTIVRFQDVNGEDSELDLEELPARCVLHETDHCDGIVFLDRMSVLKRELAKRKIKKLRQTGEWV
ncbi:MAG: peptide deformylase [Acidobacteria bacterium]|nr:MAG: peptide deformylase [Acidobacteriota bacterium]REK01293.1 MAG: peptide deformylase [Acidobacteriota bacterium]REK14249.1 MAG: peptide deformylase [Acidobacteriota bacterium]REK44964.1 MAG: peptide deformylase [Acidobacteriota bacterium]